MSFKYKWKNGRPPNRDQAVQEAELLDEGQFDSEVDQQLAEEQARKTLGIPTQTDGDRLSILPHAAPPN